MSPAAGTRLGSYEILSLLGKGGMGEVYRALDRLAFVVNWDDELRRLVPP